MPKASLTALLKAFAVQMPLLCCQWKSTFAAYAGRMNELLHCHMSWVVAAFAAFANANESAGVALRASGDRVVAPFYWTAIKIAIAICPVGPQEIKKCGHFLYNVYYYFIFLSTWYMKYIASNGRHSSLRRFPTLGHFCPKHY
jgi:hypothetical protein